MPRPGRRAGNVLTLTMAEGTSSGSTLGWPGRVAVGVLRGDPPQIFLAGSDAVLGRLLALRLVAQTAPAELGDALEELREALADERWADAVATWMVATGEVVDAYPDEEVATEESLTAARASWDIRRAPIFRDAAEGADGAAAGAGADEDAG